VDIFPEKEPRNCSVGHFPKIWEHPVTVKSLADSLHAALFVVIWGVLPLSRLVGFDAE
jgi:hypothetical protein